MLKIAGVSIATGLVIALVVIEVFAVIELNSGSETPPNQIEIVNSQPIGAEGSENAEAQANVVADLNSEIQELAEQRDTLLRELSILVERTDNLRAIANSGLGELR